MSGTQVSAAPNVLFDPLMARRQTALDIGNQNALMEQGANEMEYMARASSGLLDPASYPDEASRAAAYPGVVAQLQRYGFAKNAPAAYPGEAALRRIAAMGVSSAERYKIGVTGSSVDAFNRSIGLGGPGGGAPGAGGGTTADTTLAIPPRGTGGPGSSATLPTEYLQFFREASAETGIPMDLLIAQARQESSFDPNAKGKGGEIGLFQILPSTARAPAGMTGVDPATLTGPENVRNNILFGARYLKARMGAGDPNDPAVQAQALAAYNGYRPGGPGDPNYVRNVNQYRPGFSPTDPAAAVTAYTPGAPTPAGGPATPAPYRVAGPMQPPPSTPTTLPARTETTDPETGLPVVSVPQNQVGPQIPSQPQPPAQTTQQPQPQPATAPAIPPPSPPTPTVGNTGLTQRDLAELAPQADLARRDPARAQAYFDDVRQRQQANVARQDKYQADVRQWEDRQYTRQKDAQAAAEKAKSDARADEQLDLARQANKRAADEAAEKARLAGETLVPGTGIENIHENTLQKYAAKIGRGETLTADEQRLYDGAYYALQQAGGQSGTMTDPNNPGQTIPFQTTRRLSPSLPEPSGGALPAVVSQPSAPKKEQMTEGQGQAAAFADRMMLAQPIMQQLDDSTTYGQKGLERAGKYIGYNLNSAEYQRLRTAQEAFLAGILRKESGAAVSESEWQRYAHLYFPMPGDDANNIALKRQFRQAALDGMVREAGPTYKPSVATETQPPSRVIRYDQTGKRIVE